jgi:hypothetical protein
MESAVYCPLGKVRNYLGRSDFPRLISPATTKPVPPFAARKTSTQTGLPFAFALKNQKFLTRRGSGTTLG